MDREDWVIATIFILVFGGLAIFVIYDLIYVYPERIAARGDVNDQNNPCYEINTNTTKIVKDQAGCKELVSRLVNEKGWTVSGYDQGGFFGQDLVILKK